MSSIVILILSVRPFSSAGFLCCAYEQPVRTTSRNSSSTRLVSRHITTWMCLVLRWRRVYGFLVSDDGGSLLVPFVFLWRSAISYPRCRPCPPLLLLVGHYILPVVPSSLLVVIGGQPHQLRHYYQDQYPKYPTCHRHPR